MPYSRQDAGATVTFDLSGPTRTIKVSGTFKGLSTDIANKKKLFEGLMTGVQDTPYTFTGDLTSGGIRVKIIDMSFVEQGGLTNQVDFELNLVESAV